MANASNFRQINFAAMLRETLTSFFSINAAGQPTWGYKFCAAVLSVFIQPFAAFDAFRQKEWLIANCKWVIGQLTNVLNYLYDPIQNRIYITQAVATPEFAWQFPYQPTMFASDFQSAPLTFLETFGSATAQTTTIIHVPADIDLADLTAAVAQVAIEGPEYQIVTI